MPYTYTVVTSSGLEIARSVSERIDQAMEQGKRKIPAGFDLASLDYEMTDIYGKRLSGPVIAPVRFN